MTPAAPAARSSFPISIATVLAAFFVLAGCLPEGDGGAPEDPPLANTTRLAFFTHLNLSDDDVWVQRISVGDRDPVTVPSGEPDCEGTPLGLVELDDEELSAGSVSYTLEYSIDYSSLESTGAISLANVVQDGCNPVEIAFLDDEMALLVNGSSSTPPDGPGGGPGGGSDPSTTGIWNRFGSEYGYETDVAYGGIAGESADRVYMCELPGSPSAGLYKGHLVSANLIRWDAVHGIPDYEVVFLEDGTMTFLPQNGTGTFQGKYQRGTWTPGACDLTLADGELADASKWAYVYDAPIEGFTLNSVSVADVNMPLVSADAEGCDRAVRIPGSASGDNLPVRISYSAVGFDGPYTSIVDTYLESSSLETGCNRLRPSWGCGSVEACVYVDNAPLPPDPHEGLACATDSFTPWSSDSPLAASYLAASDLDGDGATDLVASANGIQVLLNQGSGFAPAVSYVASHGNFAVADFNGDGRDDVASFRYDSFAVDINQGDGTFVPLDQSFEVPTEAKDITAADFDGDGDVDLALAGTSVVSVFFNAGSGASWTRADYATTSTFRVIAADLDGDGDVDLALGRSGDVGVMRNQGNGTFGQITAYSASFSAMGDFTAGDVSGDGNIDLLLISYNIYLLLGQGDGTFQMATLEGESTAPGDALTLADLNQDGTLDMAVATVSNLSGAVGVYLNRGGGNFAPQVLYDIGGQSPPTVTSADFTGDGKMDIAVSTLLYDTEVVRVLRNTCGQ